MTITQKITNPDTLFDPAPYGFSHITSIPANSSLIFIAGQGWEEDKEGTLSADFRAQVRFSLDNIATALKTQGGTMSNVVR